MFRKLYFVMMLFVFLSLVLLPGVKAQEDDALPVVQAVLFYSPTCPHCHQVITEILVPMQEAYGEQLQILALSTQEELGAQLYQAAVDYYEIPDNRLGVPTLIVAETILVGSLEAQQFSEIAADGLANGGIAWPDLPALHLVFPDLPTTAVSTTETEPEENNAPTAAPTVTPEAAVETDAVVIENDPVDEVGETAVAPLAETVDVEQMPDLAAAGEETAVTIVEEPPADPVGFAIGWMVLLFMLVASGYVLSLFLRKRPATDTILTHWLVPILAVIGLGVALYLSYVEITHVEAVCGPVGECNVVQSSSYAQIAGIPVAVLGALNYIAIIGLWFWQRNGRLQGRGFVILSLVGMTIVGTVFSIYLTGIELFVIRAVCAWCLSSAVTTTLLMVFIMLSVTQTIVEK